MISKILVPIDGSACSLKALRQAKQLAEKLHARLDLLTVIPEISATEQVPSAYVYSSSGDKTMIKIAEEVLEKAKRSLGDFEYGVTTTYLFGNVAKEIVSFSDNQKSDLIVIGSRGLGAFSRTLLGSVSQKVTNLSKVSVMVVKSDCND
ncbi:MAG: universal stress protein [Tissierellia bacterium]|nr:universal stress protein [Tissierellia bacterium]